MKTFLPGGYCVFTSVGLFIEIDSNTVIHSADNEIDTVTETISDWC